MRLELRRVTVATAGARDARRSWSERERLLLRVSDGRGAYGEGEASPLPGYSPDTLPEVEAALQGLDTSRLQRALEPGLGVVSRELGLSVLTAVAGLMPEALPAARMALETAALDLLSRHAGLPAARWLGAAPDAAVRLAALIGPAAEPDLLERAKSALGQGYTHLKVKVGATGLEREEVAAIAALRDALGASVSLRLDANGAWSESQLLEAWSTLRHSGIEFFEEPGELPAALLGELPLALDESLQGLNANDVTAALDGLHARALVLKPTALGGLTHCWALATAARAAGAGAVLSHCFEGALAFRSVAALALALPSGLAAGLAPHAALPPDDEVAALVEAGTLHGWSEPGLGAPGGFE